MRPAWGSLTQVGSIVREVVEKYKTPLTNFLRSFCGFRKELSYASAAKYSPVWRARGHMWPAPSPFQGFWQQALVMEVRVAAGLGRLTP